MEQGYKTNPLDDKIAFPVLDQIDFERAAEFGTRCSFEAGQALFSAGDQPFDCFIILSGEVCIFDVSSDERVCVVRYGGGHFTGDVDLFTGRRAVVSGEAAIPVEALRIRPEKLRQLFVRQPRFRRAHLEGNATSSRTSIANFLPGLACLRSKGRQGNVGHC